MSDAKTQITRILADFSHGDAKALDELVPLVYPYLKQVARGFLRKEAYPGTLQPTALVNEAFLRLLGQRNPDFQNRDHFFALVASFMRRVLIDRARRNLSHKRKDKTDYRYFKNMVESDAKNRDDTDEFLLRLEIALRKLEKVDPRRAKLVELKFFANLGYEEIAQSLGVSLATVKRDWSFAKAWLTKEVQTAPTEQEETNLTEDSPELSP